MTHVFQFYTSHWTRTIFWGLKIKGHNGPPQVQSTFTCKETRRKRTQTHTLEPKCCCFPSCETTSKSKNNNRHREFDAEILKLTTIMAQAVFRKLINWSAINSFAIATSTKAAVWGVHESNRQLARVASWESSIQPLPVPPRSQRMTKSTS